MSPAIRTTRVALRRVVFLIPLLLCPGAAAGQTQETAFAAAHIERTGTVEFDAPPARVFPYLEPRGMQKMAKSWTIDILHPESGEGTPGAVVRKTHRRAPVQQIWTVVDLDPPRRIKYVIYVPEMEVWEFDTVLKTGPEGGTIATVSHRITSLSERANPAVREFDDTFDRYLQRWRAAIQNAIESK